MHKHRVWRIPSLENEQPIVSKINILNTHDQPLFISIKNIYIFLFLCRKHSSLNFSKRKRKKFFLARFAGELRKKEKRKRSSVFSRRDEEERSEKLEALFVKRAICRPIIRRRSERWKESTLDAFARAMSVRNRTSPVRLGLGEGGGGGKLAVPTINWSLRFSFCGRHVNVTSPVATPPFPIHLHPTYLPISDKLSFVLRIASVFYARRTNAAHRIYRQKLCRYLTIRGGHTYFCSTGQNHCDLYRRKNEIHDI